jgi:acetyl-CoA acetyltransferase
VLAVAGEKMPRGFIPSPATRPTSDIQYFQLSALHDWPCLAMLARRCMEDYGTTEEQMAKVAVKSHKNSVHNENARYRKGVHARQVLARRRELPVAPGEICPVSDGAAAVVLCSAEEVASAHQPHLAPAAVVTTAQFGMAC